ATITLYTSQSKRGYSVMFPFEGERPAISAIKVDQAAIARNDLIVDISFTSPWPLETPIGGIVLRTVAGEPVWGSNGRFHARLGDTQASVCGVLRCEARDLPVAAGQFLLSVWLGDWYRDHDVKLDVLSITIGRGDVNGFQPAPSTIGYIDWPAAWRYAREKSSGPDPAEYASADAEPKDTVADE